MANDLLDYVNAAALGAQVYDYTKNSADSFTGGGYAAFVQAITGEPPTLVRLANNKAQMLLNKNQVVKMQKYLDTQLAKALNFKIPPSNLDIQLNPVIVPWALKYVVPTALVVFMAGWLAHWYMSK